MSEAVAAAAGQFVFKTSENGFVVGDKRFADRAEAGANSTEKKTELAETLGGSQGVARGGQAALPRGNRHLHQWCMPEGADVKSSEQGVV